ncbi:hypothetical protein E2C01_005406 [Portunus trituberculatus]|uniref:A-kinase anchor protein 7-like phosphoesterase domain-containing protein n=1 Tax=Portunus trituberculatus TaxID=210409 RepID=A0A5B7CV26_PORTR|nr:hypothetical protein [Portunus trituberculatus]
MQVVTGAYKYLVHSSLGTDTLKQASSHLRVCRQAQPLHTKPTLLPHSSTTALQTLPLQPPSCRHTPPPHLLPALHQRYSTPLLLPLRTSSIPHIPSHLRPHSSPYHTHSLPHTPCSHILPLQTPTASPTVPTHSPLHRIKEAVREIAMENTAPEERNHKRAREQDSTLSPPAKKVHHKKSPIEESCDDVKTSTQSPSWHHIQPDSQQYTQPHSDTHSQSQSLHSFPINQIPYQDISQPSSQPHIQPTSQPHSPTTCIQLYQEPQECRYKDRDTKKELTSGRSEGELDTGRLQEKGTALETGEEDMELIRGGTSGEKSREISSVGLLSEGKAEFTKERTDKEAFEEEVKGEGCLFGGEASEESMGMNVLLDGKKDEKITLKEEGSKREREEKETRNKETICMEADAELTIKEEKGLREIEKTHKNSEILTATSNTTLPANTALEGEEELRELETKPGDVEINSDIQTVTSKPALPTNTALERKEEELRGKNEIKPEDSPTHHITSLSTPSSPRKQDTHRERNNTEPTKRKANLESQITNKTPQTPRNLSKRTRSLTELAAVTKHRLGSMDSLNSTAGSSQHTRTSSIDSAKEQHSRKKKRSSQSKKLNTSGEKYLRPNYFVGIQISNPAIHHGLLKVQEDLIENDETLVRTLVDVATSHLTLLVAYLDTEDSIAW